MTDIFKLEPNTMIPKDNSYILSYPHILNYFAAKEASFGPKDVVCGAHMVYGWMPTVLDLYPEKINLSDAAKLLNTAKTNGNLTNEQLMQLAGLVNNSLVGASKLLHFVRPDKFAIWDSKIYYFFYQKKSHHQSISNVKKYREYLNNLEQYRKDDRFKVFHRSVNSKIGYDVTELRALELVMFLNAQPNQDDAS